MWMKILLSGWMLWMSVLDVKSCRVPIALLWGGGGIVLTVFLGSSLWGTGTEFVRGELFVAIVTGILPGMFLLLVAYATKAVGYGDGVVLLVLGVVLGVQKAVLVLAAALFLTAVFSAVLLLLRKVQRSFRLPFLPFLTAGCFLIGM